MDPERVGSQNPLDAFRDLPIEQRLALIEKEHDALFSATNLTLEELGQQSKDLTEKCVATAAHTRDVDSWENLSLIVRYWMPLSRLVYGRPVPVLPAPTDGFTVRPVTLQGPA